MKNKTQSIVVILLTACVVLVFIHGAFFPSESSEKISEMWNNVVMYILGMLSAYVANNIKDDNRNN